MWNQAALRVWQASRIAIAAGLLLMSSLCVGQQELPKALQAVAAIEIDLQRLMNSLPMDETDFRQGLVEISRGLTGPMENPLEHANRILAAASPPSSFDALWNMMPGEPIPLEFIFRMEFEDTKFLDDLLTGIESESQISKVGDKTVYQPVADSEPANLAAARPNAATLEVGTMQYIALEDFDPKNVFTLELNKLWHRQPKYAIIMAADGASGQAFLESLSQNMRQQVPVRAHAWIELLTKFASLRLAIDFAAGDWIVLEAEGHTESDAESLQTGLDTLIGLAKLELMANKENLMRQSPALWELVTDLVKSMKTERRGKIVTMNVPAPRQWEMKVREAMLQMRKASAEYFEIYRLRQALLSVHNYADLYGRLPFTAGENQNDQLSWRVRILPFMGYTDLYEAIDHVQAWNATDNHKFGEAMPPEFGFDGEGQTSILFVVPPKSPQQFADIRDGMANTIALIVASRRVPWMKPEDLSIEQAMVEYDRLQEDESLLVGFYDGTVRKILKSEVTPEVFRSMLDPTDGR